jgi:hypothetical protein
MHFSEAQVDVVAAETFGRDAAMFQSLLSFMTSVSLTLWVLVLVTLIVRFVACHMRDCSGGCRDPDVAAGEFGEDVEGSAAVFGRGG